MMLWESVQIKIVEFSEVTQRVAKTAASSANVEDEDEESHFEDWIFPTIEGGLRNWEAKDFVPITFINQ